MSAMLDPREAHFRIPSSHAGVSLFLRHLPPPEGASPQRVVLYVHGATFPSALSIAHRFDGRSWRDEQCAAGFDIWVWIFSATVIPIRIQPCTPDRREPLCTAEDASRQLEQAVRFICQHHAVERISIIAHSWGTIVAGRLAARCPGLIDRLVLFGAIARRGGSAAQDYPAWRRAARWRRTAPADRQDQGCVQRSVRPRSLPRDARPEKSAQRHDAGR